MKNGQRAAFIALGLVALFCWRPGIAARSAVDLAAAESAVRQADAAWAAVALSANVDAWMAFYAPDAIVFLPGERLASGRDQVRDTVSHVLRQPHLAFSWHPASVEMSPSGDLAYVIGTYQISFSGPHGAALSNQGRRLEIWRLQADGGWRCSVDSWNLDAPGTAAPPPAAAAGAPAAAAALTAPAAAAALAAPAATAPVPAAPAAPPPAAAEPTPPPAALPNAGMPPPAPVTKYGAMPVNYREAISNYFAEHLIHPESVQYKEVTAPEQGEESVISGAVLMSEKRLFGWKVKVTIDAKDSKGAYVGPRTYGFLFRGEKLINVQQPPPLLR
jgi:ketosteroid isomerase-like protein